MAQCHFARAPCLYLPSFRPSPNPTLTICPHPASGNASPFILTANESTPLFPRFAAYLYACRGPTILRTPLYTPSSSASCAPFSARGVCLILPYAQFFTVPLSLTFLFFRETSLVYATVMYTRTAQCILYLDRAYLLADFDLLFIILILNWTLFSVCPQALLLIRFKNIPLL